MKVRKVSIIFCFFFVLTCLNIVGQQIKTIDVSHGLSNNTVRCIAQDKLGFMWFGTYDGLCQYDGTNFTVYKEDNEDPFSINHNFVSSILAVDNGLWVGSVGGLNFFSFLDNKFYKAKYKDRQGKISPINNPIRKILKVGDEIIVLTSGKGIFILKEDTFFDPFIMDNKDEIKYYNMISNFKNDQFLLQSNNGLHIVDVKTKEIQNQTLYKFQNYCDQIYYSANEDLIFVNYGMGTFSKLFKYENNMFKELKNDTFKSVKTTIDYKGKTVLGTDGEGISVLSNKKIKKITPQNSEISSDAIYSLFVDNEQNLWIGTMRGGISFFRDGAPKFKTFSTDNNKLNHDFVTSIYEDNTNTLYVGTDGGGLNVYDQKAKKTKSYTTTNSELSGNNVLSIVGDGDYLWLGIYGGELNRFDLKTKKITKFKIPSHLGKNVHIWVIKEDDKGHVWVGSEVGLFCFDEKTEKFIYSQNKIHRVTEIAFSKESIWVSTYGKGLYNVSFKGDIIQHYSKKNSAMKNDIIHYLYVDSEEKIWFGTEYTGLNMLDPTTKEIVNFNEENGLGNPNIVGITEDAYRNLWVSTYNGLYKFDKQKEYFSRFGINDNLPSLQFNLNASYKNDKGRMYFGTSKGLVTFLPEEITYNPKAKKVAFTGFDLLNNTDIKKNIHRNTSSKIKLPYDQNFFTVSFSIPEFEASDKILFSSLMENFEENWQDLGTVRKVSYTNVAPGNYKLKIKATNALGEWNEESSILEIQILPPWWETTLARLFFVLLIGSFIGGLFLIQQRHLKMKYLVELKEIEKQTDKNINESKLRFFTNISHELRTPLFLLLAPLEEFIANKGRNKFIEIPKAQLESMHRNAIRLKKLISRTIDFRKLENGKSKLELSEENIIDFVKERMPDYQSLCNQKNISIHFFPKHPNITLAFDTEKMESILTNLITNAFKYSDENDIITLTIKEKEDVVVVKVKDTGRGIKKKDRDKVFNRFYQSNVVYTKYTGDGIGLTFVKMLVELHKGEISLKSKFGVGSEFTFFIPRNLELIENKKEELPLVDNTLKISNAEKKDVESTLKAPQLPIHTENPTAVNTLLIVEDEKEIASMIERTVIEDFKVLKAINGLEGLEVLKQHHPDIIICDVMMPKMDGITFVTTIKSNPVYKDIPIIMLSAKSSEEDMIKALNLGVQAYLTKPVSLKFLKQRVEIIVNQNSFSKDFVFTNKTSNSYNKEDKIFLLKCKSIIDENITNSEFNVTLISEKIGMSHSALYKKIKALTGKSVIKFVNDYRLFKALQMIKSGESNIAVIRLKCGFNDAKNFRENFKRKMGVTPKVFIQNL